MKTNSILAIAAVLSLSGAVYAADVDFDRGAADVASLIQQISENSGDRLPLSGPQHVNPGNGGDHHPGNGGDNHPGNGGDHHPGNDGDHHPGPGHHGQDYWPVYPDENCTNWEFTAQTPNTRTEKVIGEDPSNDCYFKDGVKYCRSTGKMFSREVTVNIGARRLETWEKESLKVCLDSSVSARLDTGGMLYEYQVNEENTSSIFKKATIFTLTPGAKKPSKPDSHELSVASVGAGPAGDLRLVLTDTRADYFKGGKIEIIVDGMSVPVIGQGSPLDILDSFVTVKANGSFNVAPTYELKIADKAKPGQYVVTIGFTRTGPNASGEKASTTEIFEIK